MRPLNWLIKRLIEARAKVASASKGGMCIDPRLFFYRIITALLLARGS